MIRKPVACLVVCCALLCCCSRSHSDRIVVGSKNFTESFILGELIAQQIEAHSKLKVERRFYLAGESTFTRNTRERR
jgi:glycine betaine/choline ABC-type transport system substrate-binding protein